MSKLIKTGSTAAKDDLEFLMINSSDHVTGKTGLTCTVTIRKAGGSFASPSGSVSEIANGWYRVAANATDNGTVGALLHATATGADPTDDRFEVVGFDPSDATRLGLSALPNAAAGANGGLPTGDASGRVDVSKIAGTSQTARDIGATLGAPAGASVSADIAALPTANANADALLDRSAGIETGKTPRQGLRLMLAALAGKVSGAATATATFRDTNDSKDRIVATVDVDGNRSAVTLDAS